MRETEPVLTNLPYQADAFRLTLALFREPRRGELFDRGAPRRRALARARFFPTEGEGEKGSTPPLFRPIPAPL